MRDVDSVKGLDKIISEYQKLDSCYRFLKIERDCKINKIREKYEKKRLKIKRCLEEIERVSREFLEENPELLRKKRHIVLSQGIIGFRKRKELILPYYQKEVCQKIRDLGLDFCIEYKENIKKSQLNLLDDEVLDILGIRKIERDYFYITSI